MANQEENSHQKQICWHLDCWHHSFQNWKKACGHCTGQGAALRTSLHEHPPRASIEATRWLTRTRGEVAPPTNGDLRHGGCGHLSLQDTRGCSEGTLAVSAALGGQQADAPLADSGASPGPKYLLYCGGVLEPLPRCPHGACCAAGVRTHSLHWHHGYLRGDCETQGHQHPVGAPSPPGGDCAGHCCVASPSKTFPCGPAWTSDLPAPVVAGALGCVGTLTVISSLEPVRTKLQAQRVSQHGSCLC
ncbi:solute carrier family 25 member 39-like [Herpailurus yagouaroundi]|uniref:solute carrier family 25 member 39-like n=1 Tax=Herpailurus yagouaroundi TaxID=1608482 RepID=UPI001AD6C54A|nr:solute carrier family 25 member 39-like [Puma yagouaroundi]